MSMTASGRVPAIASTRIFADRITLRQVCRNAFDLVWFWHERARQRAALADLDEHRLRDIGLTKYDVARECAKLPWQ